jgi:hypothetical protein
VRIDEIVVNRIQIGVEAGVGPIRECQSFMGGTVDITRLIHSSPLGAPVAILLMARSFLESRSHRSPSFAAGSCKAGTGTRQVPSG